MAYIQGMELVLEVNSAFHVDGPVTVELPEYMNVLPLDEYLEASSAKNRGELVLAAGRHPESGDIVFLTGYGELKELKVGEQDDPEAMSFDIPSGRTKPTDFGQTICVDLEEGTYEIAADWALDNSIMLINLGVCGSKVAYVDQ